MGYKRNKYVDDDYVELVNHYINNDIPLTELIDKVVEDHEERYHLKLDKEWLESFLVEGEKYNLLGDHTNIVLTSKGRIINTAKKRAYIIYFTQTTVGCYVLGKKVMYAELFEKYNWDYSYDEILDNYNKYGWQYQSNYGKKTLK